MQGKEELRYYLLNTATELDTTIESAKEEITKREDEHVHLRNLLSRAIRERNEAQSECQKLMLENLMLSQQLQKQNHGDGQQQKNQAEDQVVIFAPQITEVEPEDHGSNILNESPDVDSALQPPLSSLLPPVVGNLAAGKQLPEKGRLLQAVMEAGPLLQNLLLAGPLPQWQHPPPCLDSVDIPPVVISRPPPLLCWNSCITSNIGCSGKKRSSSLLADGSDFSSNITKYQKLVLH
ncbi:hypothetical protein FNV43_RR25166 [Rhamnella rubrinervis]|uniref:Uncharacterized protein n=1 Tax=Rhamnella rubrinervis TaxID=2594499 RepID=A0A8K0DRY6_9ROSA|nr:hypothetical protein FNV43_RR25166 [Rhamnella rubrinervis]